VAFLIANQTEAWKIRQKPEKDIRIMLSQELLEEIKGNS
jgi:hypothetical protein